MKKWKILDKSNSVQRTDSTKFKTGEIIRILLSNRGFKNKKDVDVFLNPEIYDVNLKSVGIDEKEFERFRERINAAIERQEKIVIYGDYDVDGICASAILWETLFAKTHEVVPFIPGRAEEGYGLSEKGIDKILRNYPETKLIITVDNGIVAYDAVDYANKKGIDVVVTDHHVKGEKEPFAFCILHTVNLCGAGIAWVLAKELGFEEKEKVLEKLELACLATVADLVPLTNANRSIVKKGLEILKNTKRIGLVELFNIAKIDKKNIGVYTIGHVIAPRINATGRIQSALNALRLLCTHDSKKARHYAKMLDDLNQNRQEMTSASVEHAKLIFSKVTKKDKVIIVAHESYDMGIIGLIASNMVESYYLPSFAITIREEISKGSARSIKGVNIVELLRSVSDTLIEVGGHPMAAGFSVETNRIDEFTKALTLKAEEIITEEILERFINIDMLLPFELIDDNLYKLLQELSPFGMANPEPVFATKDTEVLQVRKLGKDASHLKLQLEKNGKRFDAIGFGMAKIFEIEMGDKIDVAYTIDENVWNGKKSMQLKLRDIKITQE